MAKKGSKTTFKSSETVVSSEYLNKLYGGLKGTDSEQYYSSTDPLISGHVHDGQNLDGHVQKINLAEHVTGKLPIEFLDGTIETNPGLPNKSFQFNSTDTFAGSETFVFNTSDRSIQLSSGTRFWFGDKDALESAYIVHETGPFRGALITKFHNSTDNTFLINNYGSSSTNNAWLTYKSDPTGKQSLYPKNRVYTTTDRDTVDSYLGLGSDPSNSYLRPWADLNTKEVTFWSVGHRPKDYHYIDKSESRFTAITRRQDLESSVGYNQTIYLPEGFPNTSDVLKVASHTGIFGADIILEWSPDDSGVSVGAPYRSIQFNSTDTLAGSGSFIFNTSDRSVQLSKEHKFHFGSIDSENSFNIENQVTSTTSILNFSAVNSVDSQFLFKLQDGYEASIAMQLEGSEAFFHADNTFGSNEGYLGRVSDNDTLFPWKHTNTKELKLWKISSGDFNASRSVTFKLDHNHSQNYTLTLPEYQPGTSDTLVVLSHDGGGNVVMTWDTFSSGSVGVTDNIQVSDGYGGFQSTDWVISSDNQMRPKRGHHDIGDVASEVNALYINKLGTGSGDEGLYFTDSSDTYSSHIGAYNGYIYYGVGGSLDVDGQTTRLHHFGSDDSSSYGKNIGLKMGGSTGSFVLRTNRQTYDNQVLELPKTLGVAGQALVIDTIDGSYTMRTKWGSVDSGGSSLTAAEPIEITPGNVIILDRGLSFSNLSHISTSYNNTILGANVAWYRHGASTVNATIDYYINNGFFDGIVTSSSPKGLRQSVYSREETVVLYEPTDITNVTNSGFDIYLDFSSSSAIGGILNAGLNSYKIIIRNLFFGQDGTIKLKTGSTQVAVGATIDYYQYGGSETSRFVNTVDFYLEGVSSTSVGLELSAYSAITLQVKTYTSTNGSLANPSVFIYGVSDFNSNLSLNKPSTPIIVPDLDTY